MADIFPCLSIVCDRNGVRVIRQTFSELVQSASLGKDKTLLLSLPGSDSSPVPIGLVYFRAGYGPSDYSSPTSAWDVRLLLERSSAIKCPSVALQLAGAKKVQQVLAEPGVLDSLIAAHAPLQQGHFSEDEWAQLKGTWTGLYPLDEASDLGRRALKMAREHSERFVLKPQREGGGNNVYRSDIPGFLDSLESKDAHSSRLPGGLKHAEGYILMDLIQPPEKSRNYLVRAGDTQPRLGQVVSELGVYGATLFRDDGQGSAQILRNEKAGHLLRTKGRESDEGGVAVGFSVIDSPLLV